MKRQNTKKAQVTPQWMNPEWLYNETMRHIEPDLTTDKIALLDKKYAGETPEDKEIRLASYVVAFDIFDDVFEKVENEMFDNVKELRKRMKKEARVEEAKAISELEKKFGTSHNFM